MTREEERQTWMEYAGLLTVECQELIGLVVTHGWQADPKAVRQGFELRKELGVTQEQLEEAIRNRR